MSMSGGPAEERRFSGWLGVVFLIFGVSQLTAESWRSRVAPRTAANVKETPSAEHLRDVERHRPLSILCTGWSWTTLISSTARASTISVNGAGFFLVASGLCAFAMGFWGVSIVMGGPPLLLLFNLAQVQPSEQHITFVPAAFAGCLLRLVLLLTAIDSQLISLFWVEWKLLPALVVFGVVGG
mmetsp:Transcript_18850/g.38263  ORF Transcript_18850/g.38263 Transcript_18850/m.38263 type:complete len:183 (+) Transcript_18850:95-643(+)